MKRFITCAALLVVAGTVVFGQVGELRPGFIQSESDDVPIIIGMDASRPQRPVLLQKQYLAQVREQSLLMSAEELEDAIDNSRRETERLKVRLYEKRLNSLQR